MVITRLRCVITLALFALPIFCTTAKVAARATNAAKPQTQGLDTVPFANRRQRWRARLLSPILSFADLSVGKLISRQITNYNLKKAVRKLFNSHQVKDANAQRLFKSQQFLNWKNEVEAKFGDKSEKLMFSVMFKKFTARDNGGVEAIIAHALKHDDTREMGLRFEGLLLQRLADGIIVGNHHDLSMYMRYLLYCEPEHNLVHMRMQQEIDRDVLDLQFSRMETLLQENSATNFEYLEKYFMVISGKRKVANVFKDLRSVEGFNNNAFLLEKLYEMAIEPRFEVNFADFMLTTLLRAKWTENGIANDLVWLKGQFFLPDFRDKVLNPMINKLAPLLPPNHVLQYFYKEQPAMKT